jgi:hypothetical protein
MTKKNRPSYITLNPTQQGELSSFLSRGDGFYHITAQDLPSAISGSLRAKWDSALAIVSGSATSNGALVLLGHRIDSKAGQLDHHPFAVAVSSSVPGASGVFVDHLSSTRRSIELPSGFTTAFASSAMSNYYYHNPPFSVMSGSLSELPASAREALGKIVTLLRVPSSAKDV